MLTEISLYCCRQSHDVAMRSRSERVAEEPRTKYGALPMRRRRHTMASPVPPPVPMAASQRRTDARATAFDSPA